MSTQKDITYTNSREVEPDQPVLYIEKQIIKFPGIHVRIFDANKHLLTLAHGLPLKLREKIEIYSDEKKQYKMATSSTKQILDWGVTFTIAQAHGNKPLGSLRRKGLTSEFVRDTWHIFDIHDEQIALLIEDSVQRGLIRRFIFGFLPQKYRVSLLDSNAFITIHQNWNPLTLRYKVFSNDYQTFTKTLPEPFLLGILNTVAVIEGRQ